MPIFPIFPQPVYFSTLKRALTKEESKTISAYKEKTYKNTGNITSNDTYVLENKLLKNLKKDLHERVIDYFKEVVCTDTDVNPYITQSWINYTEPKEFHHLHSHSNSYISGVFYIDAKKEVDQIHFYKVGPREYLLNIDRANSFNTSTWFFPVETGNIVLFPSTLTHGVPPKKGTNTRISLSFNVFFKGKIGKSKELSEVFIK